MHDRCTAVKGSGEIFQQKSVSVDPDGRILALLQPFGPVTAPLAHLARLGTELGNVVLSGGSVRRGID
jgi:hypothetical protein